MFNEMATPIKNGGELVLLNLLSAANDSVSITDGISTVIVPTDSGGKGKVWLPKGNKYTFTSAVADNPDNLAYKFSKEIEVDGSDIRLMPDGHILYWYGYDENCETRKPENGWPVTQYIVEPVKSTNTISFTTPDANYMSAIGSKQRTENYNTLYALINSCSGQFKWMDSCIDKDITETYEYERYYFSDTSSLTKFSFTLQSIKSGVLSIGTQSGSMVLSACWAE